MKTQELHLRLRIELGMDIAIGPGKADLLEGIAEMGSIAAAGRRMQMSYKRAWYLIATLNRCFDKPLVRARKGGRGAGGAELTATSKRGCHCIGGSRPEQSAPLAPNSLH